MKVLTEDKDLLCPRITRFATEFISLKNLICYKGNLKTLQQIDNLPTENSVGNIKNSVGN